MVSPDAPSHEPDCSAREHDERIPEQRLLREDGEHLGHDAERRQDQDVHLGVAKDPEQVLPQQRVCARLDREEGCVELALKHQQKQRHGDHRDGKQQQELGDEHHPREDRHLHQGHPRGPHVDDGDDQVDGAGERRDAGDLQSERPEVDTVRW